MTKNVIDGVLFWLMLTVIYFVLQFLGPVQ